MRHISSLYLRTSLAAFAPFAAQLATVNPIGPQSPATPTPLNHALSALPWQWAQGGLGPVEVDQSVGGPLANDGQTLRINGRTFAHGLGTASTSVIVYDLGGLAVSFASWVGVDDSASNGGSVVFQVFTDGTLRYESPILRGSDFALHTGRLDLTGVRELMLVVLDAGDGSANDHADWAEPTVLAHVPPVGNGVALRARRGQWQAPLAWPLNPMHATLAPDGKLITHASLLASGPGTDPPGDPHDATRADLADIATWSHTAIDHPSEELFASGHARLARAGLLAVGGHAGRALDGRPFGRAQSSRLASVAAGWLPAPVMVQPRWGATALTLGNGSVIALGGSHAGGNAFLPEVFDGLAWRTLSSASTAGLFGAGDPRLDGTFPLVHLGPDGKVLVAGWGTNLARLDLKGSGTFDLVAPRDGVRRAFGGSVQVAPERVLVIGGVDGGGVNVPAQRSAVRIDLSGVVPSVASVPPMLFPRADLDTTLLADGQVFVSGGAATHADGDNPLAVLVPELYDPTNGRWEVLAAARMARGHRSTALLLPDARVWTGGGCGTNCAGASTAEVFEPPYLFASDGSPALRPQITSTPTRVDFGAAFSVSLASAAPIARVTLVRFGSVTHGVNTDQRVLSVAFTQLGNVLQLTAPAHGNLAPPGPYMLFALDPAGTPSVAATLELGPASPTTWQTLNPSDGIRPTARHEASLLVIGGRLYLMGGRGPVPVEEFDPVRQRWRNLGFPPVQMHHFQPIVLDGIVYVVGAFLGDYPYERNLGSIYMWDPRTNVWSVGPSLPPGRERGGAGTVLYDGKIYLIAGNNQGHNGGARPWFDVFDPVTQQWAQLPDAPRARDHFVAVVVGNKLVLAGGRRTTTPNPFTNTVPEVDIYDFGAGTWSTLATNIPTRRAGTMAVGVGRHVVIAAGESDTQPLSHTEVEALDVLTGEWATLPPLLQGRNAGGMGVIDGRAFVVTGSFWAGGYYELDTMEMIDLERVLALPSANLVVNGGFDQGLVGWIDQGDLELVPDAGIAAPSLRVENGAALKALAATAGATYDVSAFVRVSASAGTAEVGIEFQDGGGGVIGQHSTALSPGAGLQTATASGVAPVGTVQLRVRVAASGARSVVVDDVVVVRR